MKSLLLLRHAKADGARPGQRDIERPLSPRGRADAARLGDHVRLHDLRPDRVLCSPATRTRETLAVLSQHAGWPLGAEFSPALYPGDPDRVLDAIGATDDEIGRLMIVGHNPGLHQLAWELGRPEPGPLHQQLAAKFPTAALAVLSFDIQGWGDVRRGAGRLIGLVTPKQLAAS